MYGWSRLVFGEAGMRLIPYVLALAFASGCAFSTNVIRTRDVPYSGNRSQSKILYSVPSGDFVDFARVSAQGNNWTSESGCREKIQEMGGDLGADAVTVQSEISGFGQGPRCSGILYVKNVTGRTGIPFSAPVSYSNDPGRAIGSMLQGAAQGVQNSNTVRCTSQAIGTTVFTDCN